MRVALKPSISSTFGQMVKGMARVLGGRGGWPFFLRCVGNATISEPYASIVKSRQLIRELIMRALIVCAIVITAAVGLGGCFHHAQAVTQQPLKLG
jgi:hypothetical protein